MPNRLTLDHVLTDVPLLRDLGLDPAQLNPLFQVNADLASTRFGGPAIESGDTPPGATQWVWALSGGGAKGAFQLGAILFLSRDVRFAPVGIAATSVGSMNALGAAERTLAGIVKLRSAWLALEDLDDMYQLQPWVARLDAVSLLRDQELSIAQMVKGSKRRSLHPNQRMVDAIDPLSGIRSAAQTVGGIAGCLASPGGILMTTLVTPLAMPLLAPALPLVFPFLLPLLGDTVEGIASDIRRILDIVKTDADGLFNFSPMAAKLSALVDAAAIAAARTRLRLCMVDLRTQSLVYCDERHELFRYSVDKATGRVQRLNIGALHHPRFVEPALASSSIPLVNPPFPVRMAITEETIPAVDGGVREVIPVGPAFEMLEDVRRERPAAARGMIAIGAGVVNPSPADFMFEELAEPPFELRNYKLVDVGTRTLSTFIEEIADTELQFLRDLMPADVQRLGIMPSFSLGETSSIDPGLIQISIAYGWMTAFDQMLARARRLTDDLYRTTLWLPTNLLIQRRYACWRLEQAGRLFAREYPDLFEQAIEAELPAVAPAGSSLTASVIASLRSELRQRFWAGVPARWQFCHDTRVGLRGFGTMDGRMGDLVAAIRAHKIEIERLVTARVASFGLDSLPSVHELSNFRVGNENSFADWSRHWERHVIAPDTAYPTGPGMESGAGDSLRVQPFARTSTPWDAQGRYRMPHVGAGEIETWKYHIDPRLLRFDTTTAQARAAAWFERSPDYTIVRHEGYLLPLSPAAEGTIPLVQYYRRNDDNWSTTRATVPAGYVRSGPLGRVFDRARPQPAGTVPLITWFSPSRTDHLTSADASRFMEGNYLVAGGWRALDAVDADYRLDQVEGYIIPPDGRPPAGALPLYRWISPGRRDNFTTTEAAWAPSISGRPVVNVR